jgi:DNA-binding PadR family transcriptional regulator
LKTLQSLTLKQLTVLTRLLDGEGVLTYDLENDLHPLFGSTAYNSLANTLRRLRKQKLVVSVLVEDREHGSRVNEWRITEAGRTVWKAAGPVLAAVYPKYRKTRRKR